MIVVNYKILVNHSSILISINYINSNWPNIIQHMINAETYILRLFAKVLKYNCIWFYEVFVLNDTQE